MHVLLNITKERRQDKQNYSLLHMNLIYLSFINLLIIVIVKLKLIINKHMIEFVVLFGEDARILIVYNPNLEPLDHLRSHPIN